MFKKIVRIGAEGKIKQPWSVNFSGTDTTKFSNSKNIEHLRIFTIISSKKIRSFEKVFLEITNVGRGRLKETEFSKNDFLWGRQGISNDSNDCFRYVFTSIVYFLNIEMIYPGLKFNVFCFTQLRLLNMKLIHILKFKT